MASEAQTGGQPDRKLPNNKDNLNGGKAKPKVEPRGHFRENVTLPIDSNLLKRFGTIKALLDDHRWSEAIENLQVISQTESKSLVLVQPGMPDGAATYLNVTARCNVLLSHIGEDGRKAYRQKIDPQAKRWFENWQRSRNEAELQRIVRQAFLSSYADNALMALGEAAWDRGDFASAQSFWIQLLPLDQDLNLDLYSTVLRYPDSEFDPAAVKARLILCSIMQQDTERAEDELQQFAEQYPEAQGQIGGQTARYVDLLRKTLMESRHWTRAPSSAEFATFGMSLTRYQRIPESVDLGAIRWARSLNSNLLPNQPARLPFPNECLSYHPVVYDNQHEKIVIVNDADSIRAWNILTGEPAWKSENPDPAVIYPPLPDEPTIISEKRCAGVPHYTMTLDNDRLYARMGSPVTCPSTMEARRELPTELVCLDLKREGKLVWKVAAHELFPGVPTWRFEGTPVVTGGRAYVVACRRHPQLELMVAGLDADDGRLVWQRSVGSFRTSVDDSVNRISHLLLTVGGDRLFLSTDLGAIIALNAHDGRLEWAISYESRAEEMSATPIETIRQGLTPALYHDGYLFVAPTDATSAYCIEADSGRIWWQYPYVIKARPLVNKTLKDRQWKHLLGVVPGGIAGTLIVSGTSVWGIDIESGRVAWSAGDAALTRGPQGPFGRGLIAGDEVLIPLRETIDFYNVHTGRRVRSTPLKTSDSSQQGGNLTLAGGMLVIAQPNRLAAYGEYSRLKQRIEDELTQRPHEPKLKIRLAELERSEEQNEAAIVLLRETLQNLDSHDQTSRIARRKLCQLLQDAGSAELRAGHLAAAGDRWREALTLSDSATHQVELIIDLAQIAELQEDPAKSVADIQQILLNGKLAEATAAKTTAREFAVNVIARLIAEHGREVYRDFDAAAATEFEAIARAEDRGAMHELLVRYPHAQVAGEARRLLAKWYRNAGEIPQAFAVLSEIRRRAEGEQAFVESTLSILELLQQAGYSHSMKPYWTSLSDKKGTLQVEFQGKPAQDLASLIQLQGRPLNPALRKAPRQLERTWNHELPTESHVLIPAGTAMSPDLACALVSFKSDSQPAGWRWRCLDWKSGETRWEVAAVSPIEIAQWTAVSLLIGTENGWQARTAETGGLVWEHLVTTKVDTTILRDSTAADGEVFWPVTFSVEQGMEVYDPYGGATVAHVRPSGHLSNIVGFGRLSMPVQTSESQIDELEPSVGKREAEGQMTGLAVVMQTLRPTQTWIATAVSPRDRWNLDELIEGSEAWDARPVIAGDRIIAMTHGNSLTAYQIESLEQRGDGTDDAEVSNLRQVGDRWTNRGFSVAHGAPQMMHWDRDLVVLVDAMQLASFDAATGDRNWISRLSSVPMKSPAGQLAYNQSTVYGTSQGVLRGISTKDGCTLFEKYLGRVDDQWKTTIAWDDGTEPLAAKKNLYELTLPTSIVAAWPVNPAVDGPAMISLCDGRSGEVLQRLRVDHLPREIAIDATGNGFMWSSDSITGLRFGSEPSIQSTVERTSVERRSR